MSEVIVYQVRSVDAHGNTRTIHAYETEQKAKDAIATMKSSTGRRYIYVPVPNDPNQYWGINDVAGK
jgi:hypothetical protein